MSKAKTTDRIIRTSLPVWDYLDARRKVRANGRKESWDSYFRRAHGFPTRRGRKPQPVLEGWVLPNSGRVVWGSASEARGLAVVEAAKKKTKTPERPVRMREVV